MFVRSAGSGRGAGFLRVVHGLEDGLIVLLVLAMVLLACGQILLRNVWGGGLIWADPLLRIMVLWLGLLGAMVASRSSNHITIDILSRSIPPFLEQYVHALGNLFSSAVCILLAWHGGRFVHFEYEAGSEVLAGLPVWICASIIPLAFAVMATRFLVHGLLCRARPT